VKNREKRELAYKVDKFKELIAAIPNKNYGGSASLEAWRYTPQCAKKHFSATNYVNNSSLFIVYKWRGFKISVAGDLESDGMAAMVASEEFQASARGSYILIPSHHGHVNGFPAEWVSRMGKPYVSIISVQERDPCVDSRYFSPEFARGVSFGGKTRYALTTRADGGIEVEMWHDDDKAKWNFSAQ
jgi:hypothetical protein